jgi:radical SAM protein with 4Fe4S-binding SPASM domain
LNLASFYDKLSLLRAFTAGKRLRNAWQLYRSFHQSQKAGTSLIKGLPVALSIEPTTSCNLRCPQCPSGLRAFSRPTGMLKPEMVQQVLNELEDYLAYLTLYFQGEPYLNPDFLKIVRMASDKQIYTATSTNAHYLTKENAEATVKSGLKKLIISIDGVDQESYAHYRIGGKLEKVLDGTKNLMGAKKKLKAKSPFVIWQFIVFKHNQDQVPLIKKMAKAYHVDELQIKTAQVYDFETATDWIPDDENKSRYKKENGRFVINNSLFNKCWKMWHSAVVTWDGKVVPCCFDKDATHQMGKLNNLTFDEIWRGEAYQSFRNKLFIGRKEIDICKNCSEGTKIWVNVN